MSSGAGHPHRHLYVDGSTGVHDLPPETKIVGLVAFVLLVAVTPRELVGAFAVDALALGATAVAARVPLRRLATRLGAIVPFIAFAVFLPFLGDGAQTSVVGLELSVDGLWAAWNIIAKATLGASAAILVTATTPVPDLLAGLSRLRLPSALVGIVSFMFRYLDLIVDQFSRMRRAMAARAHDPRWITQVRPIAASAGTLFVRTYERGERIHGAMLARGYSGRMPGPAPTPRGASHWVTALLPATISALGLLAWTIT